MSSPSSIEVSESSKEFPGSIFEKIQKRGYPLDLFRFELCKITEPITTNLKYEEQCQFFEKQLEKLREVEISKISFEERLSKYIQGMIYLAESQQTSTGLQVVENSIEDLIRKLQLLQNSQFEEFQKATSKDRTVHELGTGLISTFSGFAKFFSSN